MTLFDKHHALLDQAVRAAKTREYWSAFPENPSPKIYGETAQADGQAAAEAYLGKDFPLQQPGERGRVATEQSPYGVAMDVRYPDCDPLALVAAAQAAAQETGGSGDGSSPAAPALSSSWSRPSSWKGGHGLAPAGNA